MSICESKEWEGTLINKLLVLMFITYAFQQNRLNTFIQTIVTLQIINLSTFSLLNHYYFYYDKLFMGKNYFPDQKKEKKKGIISKPNLFDYWQLYIGHMMGYVQIEILCFTLYYINNYSMYCQVSNFFPYKTLVVL